VSRRAIVIDCDPGVDDAIAILLALASPEELNVLGITTVAGNVGLDRTSANALRIRDLVGREDPPVHGGCSRPLLRPLVHAENIHGETGLDGADLPAPRGTPADAHAVDFLIEICAARPGEITICALGPLTNLALAMIKDASFAANVGEIVLMGGAIGRGNITPAAEFNAYVDPHAASVVFSSGAVVTMIGLDVTHRAIVTPARLDAVRAIDTPVGRAVAGLLDHYHRVDIARYGEVGSPLHDPCVIAYVLQPDLFSGRPAFVEVETRSEATMGRTRVDFWNATGRERNASVIEHIDAPGFFDMLIGRLARL
jgi:purine nucleosidase